MSYSNSIAQPHECESFSLSNDLETDTDTDTDTDIDTDLDDVIYRSAEDNEKSLEDLFPDSINNMSLLNIVYGSEDDFNNFYTCETREVTDHAYKPKPAPKKYDVQEATRSSIPDSLQVYHSSIAKYKPLSREEERKKFVEYTKTKAKIKATLNQLNSDKAVVLSALFKSLYKNYATFKNELQSLEDSCEKEKLISLVYNLEEIRNYVVTSNLRFVIKVAKSFWKDNDIEMFKTLISAGNMGLFIAVDKFDYKRGLRFLSYAAHWIALEIRLELTNDCLVRVPVWWKKVVQKMVATYNNAQKENLTIKELSHKAKVHINYVKQLNNNQNVVNPENLKVNNMAVEYHCNLTSHIDVNPNYTSHEEDYAKTELRRNIQEFLFILPTKNQEVMRNLFGLLPGDRAQNLRQVGQAMALSSERVRQIKIDTLKLLRRNLRRLGYTSVKDIMF